VLAIPPLAFWDATAIALLIGMVFTRIGCCLHGCCAGRPSDGFLALYLPDSRGVHRRRLPAQLFEACLAALILPGSIQAANRIRLDGALFLCSLAAYAAGRWMLEPTRETIDRAGGWSLNRIVSAALVVVAATAVLSLWVAKGGAAAASH
jgi:phosphatidylglycerol:prolipoprotein diacylglycerol transferase